jgi:hypothetical protein
VKLFKNLNRAMIGPVAGGVVYEYMGFQMATFFIVVMFVAIVS